MTRLQAFVVVFVVLAVQTCFLIVSGYSLGEYYAFPTFLLFTIVDLALVSVGVLLKVVTKE